MTSKTKMTIRSATLADYDGICAVMDEGDAHHREALPHIFKKPDGPARPRDEIERLIDADDADLLVALVDDLIVGVLVIKDCAMPDVPLFRPGRFALVDNLAVSEAARRCGVGRALMASARQWAEARGLPRVQLSVWAFNEGAIAFYEALGYKAARLVMDLDLG